MNKFFDMIIHISEEVFEHRTKEGTILGSWAYLKSDYAEETIKDDNKKSA